MGLSFDNADILKSAWQALKNGNRQQAFDLATIVSMRAPQIEDPWLILGVLSEPNQATLYFDKALAINNNSQRAKMGIQWAGERMLKRIEGETGINGSKGIHHALISGITNKREPMNQGDTRKVIFQGKAEERMTRINRADKKPKTISDHRKNGLNDTRRTEFMVSGKPAQNFLTDQLKITDNLFVILISVLAVLFIPMILILLVILLFPPLF